MQNFEMEKLVSVVIATLGGPELLGTIAGLNKGSIVPKEILVCLPGDNPDTANVPKDSNVKIIATGVRGQVHQRAIGFQYAKYDFVLQLDDDIELQHDCLSLLVEDILKYPVNTAIAPSFYLKKTREYAYKKEIGLKYSFLYWIMNGSLGFQSGMISKSGMCFNIILEDKNKPLLVDWVAGGCLLHNNINLLKYNFYPYKGKAYCEDLFHSHILHNNNIQLMVHPRAHIFYELLSLPKGQISKMKERWELYRGLFRFVIFSSANYFRIILYLTFLELFYFYELSLGVIKKLSRR